MRPDDLPRLFVERANAGDVEGLVRLYEPDAVLALPDGTVATGSAEIRAFYARLLAGRPTFAPGAIQPAIGTAEVALTSTRLSTGGATAEIARRQPDGTWRWLVDQPKVL